ncbi:MAG TPA: hypothetical protein VHE14_09645 [Solirubrobacteraceae bacterium]|nr:hypothetical protein [Solirubrobacteraceae bacterium]
MAWKSSLLVVANVTADSDELLSALSARAERGPASFTLVVPATGGQREAAAARLDAALERMRAAGLEVSGAIGSADPVVSVREAWDPRKFDEIVVSTLTGQTSKWLQIDLPHRVERLTGAQVTHVVVSEPKPAIETAPAREPTRRGLLSPFSALGWGRSRRR